MTLYFKFWPSLLCSMSVLTLKIVTRAIMDFEKFSQGKAIMIDLINLIWLGAALFACHCVITKIGTIFVEAQILRTDDSQEKLHNDLDDQGVIILDSSQLHCGTFKLVKEPFDPNKTLELVLNIHKVEAEDRGVRFFH